MKPVVFHKIRSDLIGNIDYWLIGDGFILAVTNRGEVTRPYDTSMVEKLIESCRISDRWEEIEI